MNIRELAPGEKVSIPGVYRMNIDYYHSDCCTSPSFSSGDLVTISRSGEEYWYRSPYNPDAVKQKPKGHFHFGNAAHARILDPEAWQNDYILRPPQWKSWTSEAAQNWRMVQERDTGKIAVTEKDVIAVDYMADKIMKNPIAQAMFSDGVAELSLFAKYQDIWIKCRPDMTALFDLAFENDYKTTADNSIVQINRDIKKWGYDQKLANIAWVKRQLPDDFPNMPPLTEGAFSLLFQKSIMPHGITPVDIDPEDILRLVSVNLAAANYAAECMRGTREWEGYTTGIHEYRQSNWQREKIDTLIATGELPTVDENLRIIGEE